MFLRNNRTGERGKERDGRGRDEEERERDGVMEKGDEI